MEAEKKVCQRPADQVSSLLLNCDCPCQRILIPVAILDTWSIASLHTLDEARARRMFDINKECVLVSRVVCIAILLLPLDTPPLALGDQSRDWWGGVF